MKKAWLGVLVLLVLMSGCSRLKEKQEPEPDSDGCLMHIGLVTDSSGVDDNAFNQQVWNGILRFAEEQSLKSACYSYYQTMEESEAIPYLTQLAEDQTDLIIAADYQFIDAINTVAAMYPERNFLLIDNQAAPSNVVSALFKAEEGSYLAGMAAALKAQEMGMTAVGFIGGKSGELIGAFQAGYEQGVWAVDQTMTILVSYTEDFYDVDQAAEWAYRQYEAGAAVIYHAAGNAGAGILNEAKGRQNVFVIGVDHDQYEEGRVESGDSVVLTSMIKRVDEASYRTLQQVQQGTFSGGVQVFGLAEEGVGLELTEGRNLTVDQIAQLQAAADQIKNGNLIISNEPTLPITEWDTAE